MGSGYWVDWGDPPYPKIRPIASAPEGTESISLTAAKREIVEQARDHRVHWLTVINRTRAMTPAKIDEDEEFLKDG